MHTAQFKRETTHNAAVAFLSNAGYVADELTMLQQLGYTDGTLFFSKGELKAFVSKHIHITNAFDIFY